MAHIRRPLAAAAALNAAVVGVEAVAGLQANSLSLVMDAVHNFSDQLGLICLFLAYVTRANLSRGLQRGANLANSVGLIAVSAVVVWQAAARFREPQPVVGWLPIAVGILAALGNWGVARVLRKWQHHNAAIRLAYLHNLGDVYVSALPVVAGALVSVTGRSFFDPLIALLVAAWIIATTLFEVLRSSEGLMWPEDARCPHDDVAAS
jgi:cation diffusion facilitator family transporter